MPVVGRLVTASVSIANGMELVSLVNRSGGTRVFRVGEQAWTVTGNTTVGVIVTDEFDEVTVDGMGVVWAVSSDA